MSETLRLLAVNRFLDFYRSDLDSETIDDSNVVLSFPVHFSGFHRIEITVTQLSADRFVISDGAKTIEELKNAGYDISSKLRQRLEKISRLAQIRVVNDYLVSETDEMSLGSSIQRFVEAAKTIGDAYLVQRATPSKDTNLITLVTEFLAIQGAPYQTHRSVEGRIEKHSVDFLFPPNGVPGLALSVMRNPTRMAAEAWAFKSSDIKAMNTRMRVGVVYEAELASDRSKAILQGSVDVSVPSSEISMLAQGMRSIGLLEAS
jgi:hypothetical protein